MATCTSYISPVLGFCFEVFCPRDTPTKNCCLNPVPRANEPYTLSMCHTTRALHAGANV